MSPSSVGSEVVVSLVFEYRLRVLPNWCLGVMIAGDTARESCELSPILVGNIERVMGDDEEKAPTLLALNRAISAIIMTVCLPHFRSPPEFILRLVSVAPVLLPI